MRLGRAVLGCSNLCTVTVYQWYIWALESENQLKSVGSDTSFGTQYNCSNFSGIIREDFMDEYNTDEDLIEKTLYVLMDAKRKRERERAGKLSGF